MTAEKLKIVKEKMIRIAELLDLGGRTDWSSSVYHLAYVLEEEPVDTKYKILRLYGGMGSLNDIVIYQKGNILIPETNELDKLRTEVYDLVYST